MSVSRISPELAMEAIAIIYRVHLVVASEHEEVPGVENLARKHEQDQLDRL